MPKIDKVLLTKKIPLKPEFLNENIKNYLYRFITKNYLGICNKDIGYILSINEIRNYESDEIMMISGGDIMLVVTFTVMCLKPKIGKKYEVIIMEMNKGEKISCCYKDVMYVLIPSELIKNYKYNADRDVFENKKLGITMKKGDTVVIELKATKYKNNEFYCIGELL